MDPKYPFLIFIVILGFFMVFNSYERGNANGVQGSEESNFFDSNDLNGFQDNTLANAAQDQTKIVIDSSVKDYFLIAANFLAQTPTFAFDGIPETVALFGYQKFSEKEILFKFRYYSEHPGYGERSGAPLPEQKTLHGILILVKDGKVTFAGTDNKYDEINKQYLLFNPEIK